MTRSSNSNANGAAQTAGAPGPTSPTTRTHPECYMPGGDVLILVQKPTPTYLRISSWFLQGSDFLKIKAATDAEPLPGMESAIVVNEEATVEQMAWLCWVWLNPLIDDYSKATLADWFTILRLAQLWNIPSVKAMALRYIQPQLERDVPGLVDRIQKYEDHSAPAEVLLPLYVELCRRDIGLTDAEWDVLQKLPGARIRRVVKAREKIARMKGSTSSLPQAELDKYVAKTLGLPENVAPLSAPPNSGTSTSGSSGGGGEQNVGGVHAGGGGGSSGGDGKGTNGSTRSHREDFIPQTLVKEGSGIINLSMSTLISLIVSMNLAIFWKLL